MVIYYILFSDKISHTRFAMGRQDIDLCLPLLVYVCYFKSSWLL